MTNTSSFLSAKNIFAGLLLILLVVASLLVLATASNIGSVTTGSSSELDLLEERERAENLIAGLADRRQEVDLLIAGGFIGEAINEANLALQDLLLANSDFEKMVANGDLEDRQDAYAGVNAGVIALEGIIEAIRPHDPLEAERLTDLLDAEVDRDLGTE